MVVASPAQRSSASAWLGCRPRRGAGGQTPPAGTAAATRRSPSPRCWVRLPRCAIRGSATTQAGVPPPAPTVASPGRSVATASLRGPFIEHGGRWSSEDLLLTGDLSRSQQDLRSAKMEGVVGPFHFPRHQRRRRWSRCSPSRQDVIEARFLPPRVHPRHTRPLTIVRPWHRYRTSSAPRDRGPRGTRFIRRVERQFGYGRVGLRALRFAGDDQPVGPIRLEDHVLQRREFYARRRRGEIAVDAAARRFDDVFAASG